MAAMTIPTDAQLDRAGTHLGARFTLITIRLTRLYKNQPPINISHRYDSGPEVLRDWKRCQAILSDPSYDQEHWSS